MKTKMSILTVILALALLAGCGVTYSNPQENVSAPTGNPAVVIPSDSVDMDATDSVDTDATDSVDMETTDSVDMDVTDATTEVPTEEPAPFVVTVRPVITAPQNQVTVTTVDEFLAAIAPNTEIVVDAELLDLSKATGYGKTNGDYYYWADAYDGPELYIAEVSDLTIRGSGEDHNANVISSVPRYSNVLNFCNCSRVMVSGLTAGHTEEPGYCVGGVLYFLNCQDILVEDCGLFGCGTLGVTAESSKNIQIVNNDIYDCTVGGVELNFCDDVNVDGNTFRDLGGAAFRVYQCKNVTCEGAPIHDFNPR